MKLITYLILGTISSIITILPLSHDAHIILFQNLFNTQIFDNQSLNYLFIIPSFIATLITSLKLIRPKLICKNYQKFFLFTFPFIIILIIHSITSNHIISLKQIPFIFLINAILLLFIPFKNCSKSLKDISLKQIFFLSLLNLLTFIKGIPIFTINFFGCQLCKLTKESSFKYALCTSSFSYLLSSSKYIPYLFTTDYITELSISFLISFFIATLLIKYLLKLINQNKLHKLSFYLIIIALFTLFWFR